MPSRHCRRGGGHHIGRRVAVAATALVVGLCSTAVAMVRDLNSNITGYGIEEQLGSNRPTVRAIEVADKDPTDPFGGKALNIAVFGSDSREGENAKISKDVQEGLRSDVAMIVHISADRSRMDIVSIPRDTTVPIPPCTLEDGTVTGGLWTTKFNAAFARGGESGNTGDAAACAIQTIESISDVRMDGFAVVDFAGFVDMVDALGKVEMCIPEDMSSSKARLDLKAGMHKLDGKTALAFARARTGVGLGDGSDLGRLDRQHELLAAMVRKVRSKNLLFSSPDLYRFVSAATQSLSTSEDLSSVTTLAGLGFALRNIRPSDVTAITAPYAADPNTPANVILTDKAAKVFDALAEDKELPRSITGKAKKSKKPSASASASPGASQSASPGADDDEEEDDWKASLPEVCRED
ncbi:MAG: LCP family protein [Bifidobacteriaceae bacterium]|nr:LCP family protein [Bifidobacteriaceae bacterium]